MNIRLMISKWDGIFILKIFCRVTGMKVARSAIREIAWMRFREEVVA